MDLDLDGMLKVSARERATGVQKQVVIENALAQFAAEERDEARERLDRLWVDQPGGLEDEEDLLEDEEEDAPIGEGAEEEIPSLAPGPREGQREAVQARALLEKADRLMERVQAEDKPEVQRLMEKVRTTLTDRLWDKLASATNELADVLFYLEDA
jgi:molecular chaperone DnaK